MGHALRLCGRRWVVVAVVCGVGMLGGAPNVYPEDESSQGVVRGTYTFGKIHGVMKALQGVLGTVLDGFLTGDESAIRGGADTVTQHLQQVSGEFRTRTGEEEEGIQRALRTVTAQAQSMQVAAQAGDYRRAHRYFSNMVGECVQCHQAYRLYGQFPQAAAQQAPGDHDRPSSR